MITHVFAKNLVTANDLIGANRTNKYYGATLKKKETKRIIDLAKGKKPHSEVDYPLFIFMICEFTRRSCDFDNGWTAVKPILDGLQKSDPKIILKDSLTYIGTPATIEYVRTKRKATHLILSPDYEEGLAYTKKIKADLESCVESNSNLPFNIDQLLQF